MNRLIPVLLFACLLLFKPSHTEADPIEYTLANFPDLTTFQFEFCGERIPVELPEVREQLKAELVKRKRSFRESKELLLRTYRYKNTFQKILRKAGIPEDFFYIAVAESELSNVTSPKGATGFWQFMPQTAQEFGLELSKTVDERYDPEKATYAASKYFRRAHRVFKNWALAATSYNIGIGGLQRAIEKQQTTNLFELDLNQESKNYIYRIVSLKHLLENPTIYGIYSVDYQSYSVVPYKIVTIQENIESFSQFSDYYKVKRSDLRLMNPWMISDKLIAKAGKSYHIRVPLKDSFRAEELLTDSMRKLRLANRREIAENTVLPK
ncbi:MAG: lytic transglycosylase domain-containing protein [Bacteroidota bacterium]